jgi:hypothetical protein
MMFRKIEIVSKKPASRMCLHLEKSYIINFNLFDKISCVMPSVVLALTVRTNIHQSGVHVSEVHSATIMIVRLIIREIVRINVFTAVHVENLIVLICIRI